MDKLNYNYVISLNDEETILVKTILLLNLYEYYKNNHLLTQELINLFDNIFKIKFRVQKYSIEPEYLKITIKDLKTIYKYAPEVFVLQSGFKLEKEKIKKLGEKNDRLRNK